MRAVVKEHIFSMLRKVIKRRRRKVVKVVGNALMDARERREDFVLIIYYIYAIYFLWMGHDTIDSQCVYIYINIYGGSIAALYLRNK
jgi:dolichol kinase